MPGPLHDCDPLTGTPYRVLRRLGRGGMGEVLEAEHRALGKIVVVKVVHAGLAGDPSFLDRFRIEAQALALIADPNVVAVLDCGATLDGRPFLVMERLAGRPLNEELSYRGHCEPMEAIAALRDVLSGLDAVHAHGIVHRDVKPANVLLCDPDRDGVRVAKLLDFGVAKLLATPGGARGRLAPQYPTEQGAIVGLSLIHI